MSVYESYEGLWGYMRVYPGRPPCHEYYHTASYMRVHPVAVLLTVLVIVFNVFRSFLLSPRRSIHSAHGQIVWSVLSKIWVATVCRTWANNGVAVQADKKSETLNESAVTFDKTTSTLFDHQSSQLKTPSWLHSAKAPNSPGHSDYYNILASQKWVIFKCINNYI